MHKCNLSLLPSKYSKLKIEERFDGFNRLNLDYDEKLFIEIAYLEQYPLIEEEFISYFDYEGVSTLNKDLYGNVIHYTYSENFSNLKNITYTSLWNINVINFIKGLEERTIVTILWH